MTLTTAPRGTFDLMPQQALVWQWMESKIRDVLLSYGYGEIRTPIFEHTELFQRGIGETTDIVEKEMYTLTDKGGRSLTLRPEGTTSVVRAYIQHKLYGQAPVTKLLYRSDVPTRTAASWSFSTVSSVWGRNDRRRKSRCRCRGDHLSP